MERFAYAIPQLFTALLLTATTVYALRERRTPAVRAFAVWSLLLAAWSTAFALSILATDPETRLFWAVARQVPPVFAPLAGLVLTVRVVGGPPLLERRRTLFLLALPTAAFTAVVLAKGADAIWEAGTLRFEAFNVTGRWSALFLGHTTYVLTLSLVSLALLTRAALRAPSPYRRQARSLLAGLSLPTIVHLLFLAGISPVRGVNFTPALAGLTVAGIAYALVHQQLFQLVPIARHAAVERMSDAMLVFDPSARLVDFNTAARALLGLSQDSSLGAEGAKTFSGQPALVELATGAGASSRELVFGEAGAERVYEAATSPITDRRDAMVGRLVILRDVTDRKRREDEADRRARALEEIDRTKDTFLAIVSHELRTPLNTVVGLTDALIDEPLPPAAREYVRTIQGSATALVSLVGDILDLTRLRAGRLDIEASAYSVRELVESTVGLLAQACQRKGLELSWVVEPQLPWLLGDPGRLAQILLNLAGNAVKFTDAGRVSVEARLSRADGEEPQLVLRVVDTGPGIAPHQRETIFEEFTQIDGSTTRRYGGTGLGLPIVRRLAGLMGGVVSLAANEPQGCVFTVRLPARQAGPDETARARLAQSRERPPPSVRAAMPRRILVVDDVPENGQLIKALLTREPVEVVLCLDAATAIAAFSRERFDVVLLDVQMPRMDGFDALEQMREIERVRGLAPVPIVAVTAHAQSGEHTSGERFTEHLQKPLRKHELFSLLERLASDANQNGSGESAEAVQPSPVAPEALELRDTYLARRRREIEELERLLARRHFEGIAEIGHRLKGSGGSFGFPEFGELGEALERNARARKEENLRWLVDRLKKAVG